jgi:hypothetical protein
MDSKDFQSLVKIGKGTKRKMREINLLEVAEEMKSLYARHKSLGKVARIAKLSQEMVREFLKINDLHERAKNLIKAGSISSVDICYRLSKLEQKDQAELARLVVESKLSSEDVRSIIKYKIDNPDMHIGDAVDKTLESKDKKVYVAYLGIEKDVFDGLTKRSKSKDPARAVLKIFKSIIPYEFIVSFELNGRVVILKVSKEGLNRMREQAKMLNVPLKSLASTLIKAHLEGR